MYLFFLDENLTPRSGVSQKIIIVILLFIVWAFFSQYMLLQKKVGRPHVATVAGDSGGSNPLGLQGHCVLSSLPPSLPKDADGLSLGGRR